MEVKTKKIQPDGLPSYAVPPPIELDPDTTLASAPAPPEALEERDDMIYDDFEGGQEGRDVQLTIDNEVDEDLRLTLLKYVFRISYIGKNILFEKLTPGVL